MSTSFPPFRGCCLFLPFGDPFGLRDRFFSVAPAIPYVYGGLLPLWKGTCMQVQLIFYRLGCDASTSNLKTISADGNIKNVSPVCFQGTMPREDSERRSHTASLASNVPLQVGVEIHVCVGDLGAKCRYGVVRLPAASNFTKETGFFPASSLYFLSKEAKLQETRSSL